MIPRSLQVLGHMPRFCQLVKLVVGGVAQSVGSIKGYFLPANGMFGVLLNPDGWVIPFRRAFFYFNASFLSRYNYAYTSNTRLVYKSFSNKRRRKGVCEVGLVSGDVAKYARP